MAHLETTIHVCSRYTWGVAPSQDASDHKDLSMFSRRFQPKPHLPLESWEGGHSPKYTISMDPMKFHGKKFVDGNQTSGGNSPVEGQVVYPIK